MGPERIELGAKERERLKVLQQVKEGHLRQIEAARRLRLTDRHIRRLQKRLRAEGDGGIVHRLRGRRSNRKIPDSLADGAMRQLRQARYAGFWPHTGRRASGAQRDGGEPGDVTALDEPRGFVAPAAAARESGACVATAAQGLGRTGDDGQFPVSLVRRSWSSRPSHRADRGPIFSKPVSTG